MVAFTVPLFGFKVTLPAKLEPDVVETSYPDGGVTTISWDRPVPDTVKLCSELTTPEQAVNADREPEVVIVGVGIVTTMAS